MNELTSASPALMVKSVAWPLPVIAQRRCSTRSR